MPCTWDAGVITSAFNPYVGNWKIFVLLLMNIIRCYMYLHYHLNTGLEKKSFWKKSARMEKCGPEWTNMTSQTILKYTSQACCYQELTAPIESWKSYSFANSKCRKDSGDPPLQSRMTMTNTYFRKHYLKGILGTEAMMLSLCVFHINPLLCVF